VKNVSFPNLPEGLITRPTLVWDIESDTKGENEIEVRYLTDRIDWHAEYIAAIDRDDKMQISSWVSIDNRSGATYEDALLKVVAGDVKRIKGPARARKQVYEETMTADAFGFQQRAFFEYHIYELGRRTTLRNNQVKQISLFDPAVVNYNRIYEYDRTIYRDKVRVVLEFDNSEKAGLGIPLPAGKFRIYKEDTDGSLEFAGEDMIDHTPKDELVRLSPGAVFDIKPEWQQVEAQKTGKNNWRYSVSVKLRNHKEEDVEIRVVETLGLSWHVKKASHNFTRRDASHIVFNIKVPKDGERVINYTYETRF
ncbi:MAG: DUF4139 domain-containing protein, partial [Thermoplasmata archaeon]|nr:DUF4139 domain-containing protein [Thermoplasmata archaeon]